MEELKSQLETLKADNAKLEETITEMKESAENAGKDLDEVDKI